MFSYIKLQPTSLWRGKVDPIHSTDAKLCVVRLAMICCQATATTVENKYVYAHIYIYTVYVYMYMYIYT